MKQWVILSVVLLIWVVLSGCSTTPPPAGGDWVTVWGDNKLPLGSYNPKTEETIFYGSPEEAFKKLLKVVVASEAQRAKAAEAKPVPATSTAPKKK